MSTPHLSVRLDDEQLDDLARRIAGHIANPAPAAWLDTPGAAAHLGCSVNRIHDLVRQRRVRHAKEGGRLVFLAAWLDDIVIERSDG